MKSIFNSFIFLLFVTLLASCNSRVEHNKIRIGYLPLAAELPLFVALEKGYFDEEGLKVEISRFASSNDLVNAATSGQIDLIAGAATNVILDVGHVSGKKHLLFCVNPYSDKPGYVTDHFLVQYQSTITGFSQLKSKRIAGFPGSVTKIFINLILEKYGVPRGSYEYIELLPKDWESALQTDQIDALLATEPVATQIILDKAGKSIYPGFVAALMPNVPLSGHWISAEFYKKENIDLIKKIIKIYDKSIDYCRSNAELAKLYLAKYANVREDILNSVNLNPWQKQSEISYETIQNLIDLLYSNQCILSKESISNYKLPLNLKDN